MKIDSGLRSSVSVVVVAPSASASATVAKRLHSTASDSSAVGGALATFAPPALELPRVRFAALVLGVLILHTLVTILDAVAQDLDLVLDHADGVIDLMADASGQGADRCQLLA